MYILIESEAYTKDLLDGLFDHVVDPQTIVLSGRVTSVGYYHSFDKNRLVLVLPKVFMREGEKTVFGLTKEELLTAFSTASVNWKVAYGWIRQLSVYFYRSLLEYKKRNPSSTLIRSSEAFEIRSTKGQKQYSYLDMLLGFIDFYKKSGQYILFRYIELIKNQASKAQWDKTVRKSLPFLERENVPVYSLISNKKKAVNIEEELIVYFLSILHHLNAAHQLGLSIDKSYPILRGQSFTQLCNTGLSKLRRIKYRYFTDTLRRMYSLCELFFSISNTVGIKKKRADFMFVSNYNLVFEDMVDKLFSETTEPGSPLEISLERLKYQDDGKIVDHIYSYDSLFDDTTVFYIGDSKYYKSDSEAGRLSTYKQFTYAKNVIQFNIDELNRLGYERLRPVRYRDELTEGYNISPNFFIYGYIDDVNDYNKHAIERNGRPVHSFHFEERLFDRDSLFVHRYKINFLFVLRSYTGFTLTQARIFKKEVRKTFKQHFIDFFNDESQCGFKFYISRLPREEYPSFIDTHFKMLIGKCYTTDDGRLILAKHKRDDSLNEIMDSFKPLETINS